MEEIKYPIKLQLRIDWSELDLFGHVNNVSFFKYIQAARVNYWELVGLYKMHKETNKAPILASTACQFKKPLFFPGNVLIQTKSDFIKNTSFGISHQLFNDNNELVAEAQDVMVMYDFNCNEKISIPESIKEKLIQY
jgi:acyl-CoA thioester hydrolase